MSEHLHDQSGLLLGASFVLGQAALTQTVSILCRLRTLKTGLKGIPGSRAAALEFHAPRDSHSALSKLVIVDTAANYFKHHPEWPADWVKSREQTVRSANGRDTTLLNTLKLGMTGSSVTDNLRHALHRLGGYGSDVLQIATTIQDWRETLSANLHGMLKLPDPQKN